MIELEPRFGDTSTINLEDAIIDANNNMSYNDQSLHYKESELMVKVADYIPPISTNKQIENSRVEIDTYYRTLQVPDDFYNYFQETFLIPSFTCDNITANLTYSETDTVYSCYCNNGNYHNLPSLSYSLLDYDIHFDLENKDYLLLPYLNYTTPISLCLFALGQQPVETRDNRVTILGPRFLAKFSLMVIYDRDKGEA